MKNRIAVVVLVWLVFFLCCRMEADGDPIANLVFSVSDDQGKAVSDAEIVVRTFDRWEPGPSFGKDVFLKFSARTNGRGEAAFSVPSKTGEFKYRVSHRRGFYVDGGGEVVFKGNHAGKWLPESMNLKVLFKPIVKPIGMYAKTVEARFPTGEGSYAYDMVLGDWVKPFGRGESADLIFKVNGSWIDYSNYSLSVALMFSNASDGIQEFPSLPIGSGSSLRSPREAPPKGYRPTEILSEVRVPGVLQSGSVNRPSYFFRVRSSIGEKGRFVI